MVKSKVICVFLLGSLLSLSAHADMKTWKDDKGVTHFGDTIPAEYANKSHSDIDKSGRVVNTQDVLTPEERRAKEASEAKHKAALDAERNQRLHDSSLLNTYSNVNEIDLARGRNVRQVDARVQVATSQLRDANKSLADVQQLADTRAKSGKPVPPYLKDEIQAAQDKVDNLGKDLANINAEKAALEARYDADKARYKELTGK